MLTVWLCLSECLLCSSSTLQVCNFRRDEGVCDASTSRTLRHISFHLSQRQWSHNGCIGSQLLGNRLRIWSKRRQMEEVTETVKEAARRTRSPETTVAYMQQTGSDKWDAEETEMHRELAGDATLSPGQGVTVCNSLCWQTVCLF